MKKTLIITALLLTSSYALAEEWTGKVVGVSDGDTLTVLNQQKRPIKIRLVEIDAPEKSQDYGERSKQSLSELCFNKTAKVDDKGQDRYQRTLGRVYCEGIDANAEQVKRGMAWAYRQYLTDPALADLEQVAKNQKIGLWSDTSPIPPWDYRHGSKKTVTSSRKAPTNSNEAYHTGPRGGCYTVTSSGKKRYVDHSFCGNN